jgi:hypothetical protein
VVVRRYSGGGNSELLNFSSTGFSLSGFEFEISNNFKSQISDSKQKTDSKSRRLSHSKANLLQELQGVSGRWLERFVDYFQIEQLRVHRVPTLWIHLA